MELQIISKEIIKPSSPTPHHLKTHKLSLLDQLAPDIYFPFILFYRNTTRNISHQLRNSLSKTLTFYYPFAGRVKDDYSIDCDDYGVPFIEANVASKMFQVLQNPEIEILEKLLPLKPNEKLSNQVNMAVQVNYFDCGGLAICVNLRHVVADGAAAINFVKNWARIACGSNDVIEDVIFDCTSSIFHPHDNITSISRRINENQRSTDCITKKFIFEGARIAALRKKIIDSNNESSSLEEYRPTRFEAVVAVIWAALIAMDRESSSNYSSSGPVASIPVNLRNRMNPPLPQHCIGNMFHAVTANWFMGDKEKATIDHNILARNIHEFTKMVNDEFVRNVYGGGAFVKHYEKAVEDFLKSSNKVRLFGFSGPIGLPYYEIDFGWGKPMWFTTVMRLNNIAMILDTCDGKGVEAWVGLPKNDMAKFEQDLGILTYASFKSSIQSKI